MNRGSVRFGWGLSATLFLFLFISASAAADGWKDGVWVAPGSDWIPKAEPDLAQRIAGADIVYDETLLVPMYRVKQDSTWLAMNADGSWDVIVWYSHINSTGYALDTGRGAVKRIFAIDADMHHVRGLHVPGTRSLYVPHNRYRRREAQGIRFYRYDPDEETLTKLDAFVPDVGGERQPMTVLPGGRILGAGSYGKDAKVALWDFDPTTEKARFLGAHGPSHGKNGVWAYWMAVDAKHAYVASGKTPWYLVCYDLESGESKVILESEAESTHYFMQQKDGGGYLEVRRGRGVMSNYNHYDSKECYWLHGGKAIPCKDPKAPPPWGKDANPVTWRPELPARPQTWTAKLEPTNLEDPAEYWYRTPEALEKAKAAGTLDAADPQAQGWQVLTFYPPRRPCRMIRDILELPDGRVFGRGDPYQGNFNYDPETGVFSHPGKIHLSQYAMHAHGGKIYLSGYPSAQLWVYDPQKPYTGLNPVGFRGKPLPKDHEDANPRVVAELGLHTGVHKMYAGATASDGRLYFGGRCYRSSNGGGLGWYDPETGESGGWWKPFLTWQIHFLAPVDGGRILAIGTKPAEDKAGGAPAPESAEVLFFDVEKQKLLGGVAPMKGAKQSGPIAGFGGGRVLGLTYDPDDVSKAILYGLDARAGKVLFRKRLPYPLAWRVRHQGGQNMTKFAYRIGPDGMVWTYIGPAMVRIDPKDASVNVVGWIMESGPIAFSGKDLYLGGSVELRRMSNVVPEKKK